MEQNLLESSDNNHIIGQMFAQEIQAAREKNSLKTICSELGLEFIF